MLILTLPNVSIFLIKEVYYEKCKNISILFIQEYLPITYQNYEIKKDDNINELVSKIISFFFTYPNESSILFSIKNSIIQFLSIYGFHKNMDNVLTYQETLFYQIQNAAENIVNNCENMPMKSSHSFCISSFYQELIIFVNKKDRKKLKKFDVFNILLNLTFNQSREKLFELKVQILEILYDALIENEELKELNEKKVKEINDINYQIINSCFKQINNDESFKLCLTPKIKSISLLLPLVCSPYNEIVDYLMNISSNLVGKNFEIVSREILILFLPKNLQYKNKLKIKQFNVDKNSIILCSWISFWFEFNWECS